MKIQSVCVFCGSSSGDQPFYRDAATAIGREVAERGWTLVYGGGNIGLMGLVADAALAAGGKVIGVIPQHLFDKEVAHLGLTNLVIVDSMHERKARMADESDAFVALPGGFGTFEEFCEVLTWAQLGLHSKPCGLLNVGGFYDSLLRLFDHAEQSKFLRTEHRSLVLDDDDISRLLDRMLAHEPPKVHKWIDRSET